MENQPVWHYDVHRQHAHEDLRFYLLKFTPSYDRTTVFREFQRFCREHGIFSYGLYEVFGPVDLIFRCWLPHDVWIDIVNAFESWKLKLSPQCRIGATDQFDILRCRHHFLWHDAGTPELTLPDVKQLPEIMRLNGEIALDEADFGEARERLVSGRFLGFRTDVNPAIRFFIVVSAPESGMPDAVRADLMNRISDAVRDIHGIRHLEIYEGGGTSCVLIDGVIDFTNYSYLAELQISLRKTGIVAFQCRTTTFLCVDNIEGVYERDNLRFRKPIALPAQPPVLLPLNDLLALEESDKLELKGSVRMNMHRYLTGGEVASDKALEEKFLQTIVAFRNSDGGDFIVGALELDRFPPAMQEKIQTRYPKVGKYYLCGIDPDWKSKGLDKFQRYIRDMVADRIGQTTASEINVECTDVQNATICHIHVPKLTGPGFEYLDGSHFIVRRGAASVELTGSAQEKFQDTRRLRLS